MTAVRVHHRYRRRPNLRVVAYGAGKPAPRPERRGAYDDLYRAMLERGYAPAVAAVLADEELRRRNARRLAL